METGPYVELTSLKGEGVWPLRWKWVLRGARSDYWCGIGNVTISPRRAGPYISSGDTVTRKSALREARRALARENRRTAAPEVVRL